MKKIQKTFSSLVINPNAVICPYCDQRAALTSSREVYGGRDYGPIYLCKCKLGWAYVGCHPGTTKPLGRLADQSLREARKEAHAAFDPLWKGGSLKRKEAYKWLIKTLGITARECHMGEFDVETCKNVVKVCNAKKDNED